jgi:hypothetical protein
LHVASFDNAVFVVHAPREGDRAMLDDTFAGWAATVGLIAALFLLDLFVTRPGHAHTVGFREAVFASLFYVGVAIAFGMAAVASSSPASSFRTVSTRLKPPRSRRRPMPAPAYRSFIVQGCVAAPAGRLRACR